MPLLNYTTTIPVAKTTGEIIGKLVTAGARNVSLDYDAAKQPITITFSIETAWGLRVFRLPVNSEAVYKVLCRDMKVPQRLTTRAHAAMVGWRVIKDWLEAQLALIATEQVSLTQIMLPYMTTPQGTVYELFERQRLSLPAPAERDGTEAAVDDAGTSLEILA